MRFIADGMLGKLTRWLRMLGHDVTYYRALDDEKLVKAQVVGQVESLLKVGQGAVEDALLAVRPMGREREVQVETAALANERIAELLEGKTVRKVIVKPRIVNIVAN